MVKKIELEKPENMAVAEIEAELQMRLKDLELCFNAESPDCGDVLALREAQRLIHVGDGYVAELKTMDIVRQQLAHSESRMRENSGRIIALFANLNKDSEKMSAALATVEQFELIDAVVVNEFDLSQEEVERLAQLEFAIQKGVDAWKAAGEALREIRDSGLYKSYGTFEEYCSVKWGFSRARAYQFIEAEKTVNNLLTGGIEPDALPSNEAQARALSAVPEDRQAEVWQQSRKDGKPSAAKIRAVAKDALTPSPSSKGGEGCNTIPPTPPCKGGLIEVEWNPNLWETPRNIAEAMAKLLRGGEAILEPCAGTGQVCRALAEVFEASGWEYELTAIEILKERAAKLEDNRYFSIDADFLQFDFGSETFDVVITNPPFDIGMEILERSLQLIEHQGRLLFLLPIAYFQSQERARRFAGMNAYIHRVYPVIGRIAYLKNGVPESGRQCEDAVFDIRLGKLKGQVEFIWQ